MIDLRDIPVIGKAAATVTAALHLLGAAPELVSTVLLFLVSNVETLIPIFSAVSELGMRVPWIPSIVAQYGQQALTGAFVVLAALHLFDLINHYRKKQTQNS